MAYRLSVDLGTNSIGWCLLIIGESGNPMGIERAGIRIFSDGRNPKDGSSLAVQRRVPRQMRRRRDRYLLRREQLMAALVLHNLMPADVDARKALESLDPYDLRTKGLDQSLPLFHLGRAIFHLNQRRGFKSNRKLDKGADNESGKIKSAIRALHQKMEDSGARTAGEFLHGRHVKRECVRSRINGEGAKSFYDFYPERALTEAEFDQLWDLQQTFHPDHLTGAARDEIRSILFFQRPLRPVRPGKCTFNPDDDRAPWALPLAQRFRIWQDVNALRFKMRGQADVPLTEAQRQAVVAELQASAAVTFKRLRKILKLGSEAVFTIESPKVTDLIGDKTAARLSKSDAFGKLWFDLPLDRQNAIVERLLDEADEQLLVTWLQEECRLDAQQAERVADITLPDGHCRLGRLALAQITAQLEQENVTYAEAAKRVGYHHSDFRDGQIFDQLPYYGEALERHVAFGSNALKDQENPEKFFGKIANPTVHVAMNQLRKLVNAVIQHYGHPAEIVVEVARDLKNSKKKRDEIKADQKKHQDRNDRYRAEFLAMGLADNGENRLRMRLWEELNYSDHLDRRCPYTGEQISLTRLFSSDVEIEHILPFSQTLDNSAANKIVSMRWANRIKANRTPHQAFAHGGHPQIEWDHILDRAESLPANKKWRFLPNAMERFNVEERDFLDRQLTDTQYLSRLAKEYLCKVCNPNKVWVTPGRLTAMLRGLWGLNHILSDHNQKNRTDHRHHAIDAVVIGVTDRSLLQQVAHTAARAEEMELEKLLSGMPEPWANFRADVQAKIQQVIVSHKPDHGRQGALHNDTAYGLVTLPDAKGVRQVVTRIPLTAIAKKADIDSIRDDAWRDRIRAALDGVPEKEWKIVLTQLSEQTGIRRIRVLESLTVIPIKDKTGREYKAYKGDSNCYYEIFQTPKGKWAGEVISTFDANQKDFTAHWHKQYPTARLVLRLFKNDMIQMDHDGQRRVMRVVMFSEGKIILSEHFEGGSLRDRHKDPDDSFRWFQTAPSGLQDVGARKAGIKFW